MGDTIPNKVAQLQSALLLRAAGGHRDGHLLDPFRITVLAEVIQGRAELAVIDPQAAAARAGLADAS